MQEEEKPLKCVLRSHPFKKTLDTKKIHKIHSTLKTALQAELFKTLIWKMLHNSMKIDHSRYIMWETSSI